MTNEEKPISWYAKLQNDLNDMSDRFGLDDFQANELKKIVTQVAYDQFKAGSKAGYNWAKNKELPTTKHCDHNNCNSNACNDCGMDFS